jgi:hypothetical protein
MHNATKSYQKQVLIWLLWALTLFVAVTLVDVNSAPDLAVPALPGVLHHERPWSTWRYRLRLIWRRRTHRLRRVCRRVAWAAHWAHLARHGALTLAGLVDLVARTQLRRQLGALPVLYALLDVLQVRDIINRYCPTRAEVDHGLVAVVLILNRMVAPRPLYQVADWVSRTMLVYTLGVPASKFNDDRLGRTLDALQAHSAAIWQDIVHRALVKADIDLSVLFYDLSAFVAHGTYAESAHVTFGFAHNTPSDKRKFRIGLNATADGHLPAAFQLWPGSAQDLTTVAENMDRLTQLLARWGRSPDEVLVIGDRANLTNALAFAYDDKGVRYLAGLQTRKQAHRELVLAYSDAQLYRYPLKYVDGRPQYWGQPCQVSFTHAGRQVTHQGLVVLSGPMRRAVRLERAAKLRALRQALQDLRARIGQPHYRTVTCIQRSANAVLKHSGVSKFMAVSVYQDAQGQVRLRWCVHRYELLQAMRHDGRYLLVTNDTSLSYPKMFELYLAKDGVEKCFHVTKHDLRVSPIYVHKDSRIEGLLLINMLALLAYRIVERQVHQAGWHLTTRQIIHQLANLDIIETWCWDGSVSFRLVPVDAEQAALLEVLSHVLADLRLAPRLHLRLPSGTVLPLALPPALLADPPPALPFLT